MKIELRIKILTLFVRIYLSKLDLLKECEQFSELWLKILGQLIKGIKEGGDICDNIVESLKNILLIMKYLYLFIYLFMNRDEDLFKVENPNYKNMNLTWTVIDSVKNDIRQQLELVLGSPPEDFQ